MRTLSATLLAAQKRVGVSPIGRADRPIWKIVLTRAGEATQTYTRSDRCRRIRHIEQDDNGIAEVLLDNADGALTSIDFEQYQGVLSYGYNTSQGDEYSATAPLKVVGQQFYSAPGVKYCSLYLIGIPNQLMEDEAGSKYNVDDLDTQTVKELISAICDTTLTDGDNTPYSDYSAITVTYDSEDSVISSFKPKDYFVVQVNESRWNKIVENLNYTGCKIRAEDDGELHILVPTITGTTYDYEYRLLVDTYHSFFNKTLRNRFVTPNKEVVESHPDHVPIYTGSATSATSYALNPKIHTTLRRLTSNAQAAAIAAAIIERYELDAERGSALVPMNCGQEIWDYVKITDQRESDTRTGNVQYIERMCDIDLPMLDGGFCMTIRFGRVSTQSIGIGGLSTTGEGLSPQIRAQLNDIQSDIFDLYEALNRLIDGHNALIEYINQGVVPKWHVTEELIIPVI